MTGGRAASTLALGLGLAALLGGCTQRARPAPGTWSPAPVGWSGPGGGSAPGAPGGPVAGGPAWGGSPVAETRDPWWSAPAVAPVASPPGGAFLVVLDLRGPGGAARLPDAHATMARLGGVLRTPPLWEVAPQPGGGLGSLAAVLERELCAEDLVIVYRARPGGMERSEFAGHRACRSQGAPPAAPAPSTAAPGPTSPAGSSPAPRDPFYDRF